MKEGKAYRQTDRNIEKRISWRAKEKIQKRDEEMERKRRKEVEK